MKIITVFISFCLLSQISFASCNNFLLGPEAAMKQESLTAQAKVIALRTSSTEQIKSFLNSNAKLGISDNNGNSFLDKVDESIFHELLIASSILASDNYFFGMSIYPKESLREKINTLAKKVSTSIPAENSLQMAIQFSMQLIRQNEAAISSNAIEALNEIEKELLNRSQDYISKKLSADEYQIMRNKHATYRDVNNTFSKIKNKSLGRSTSIGFIEIKEVPEPKEKLPIGFIHDI